MYLFIYMYVCSVHFSPFHFSRFIFSFNFYFFQMCFSSSSPPIRFQLFLLYLSLSSAIAPHLATKACQLRDERVPEVLLSVEAFLGETSDPHGHGRDLLLERSLPAEVTLPVWNSQKGVIEGTEEGRQRDVSMHDDNHG